MHSAVLSPAAAVMVTFSRLSLLFTLVTVPSSSTMATEVSLLLHFTVTSAGSVVAVMG